MKKGSLIDISMPLEREMVVWPDSRGFELDPFKKISEGASSNTSQLCMHTHCGTHVDAPLHFIEKGKGIDKVAMQTLIGKARVYDAGIRKKIDRDFLEKLDFRDVERALFRSINSAYLSESKFRKDYVYLSEDAAEFIVRKKIKLVGIDYLSIDGFSEKNRPAHHVLLSSEVIILEGINLLKVKAGDYELLCLPLKIVGADGAPARALLREI